MILVLVQVPGWNSTYVSCDCDTSTSTSTCTYVSLFFVDVIHVGTNITNFVIRIMRDGERGVYEGWLQPPWF